MGRNNVIKHIKRKTAAAKIIAVLLLIFGEFMLFAFIVSAEEDDPAGMYALPAFVIIVGLLCLWLGIWAQRSFLKANPRLFEQADELFNNITYEDNIIIMSDRVIASKKNLTQMVYTEEVFYVTENVEKVYVSFIPTVNAAHNLILEALGNTALISVYGCSKKMIEETIERIYAACPNIVRESNAAVEWERLNELRKRAKENIKSRSFER